MCRLDRKARNAMAVLLERGHTKSDVARLPGVGEGTAGDGSRRIRDHTRGPDAHNACEADCARRHAIINPFKSVFFCCSADSLASRGSCPQPDSSICV